jgi:hypothetical protein
MSMQAIQAEIDRLGLDMFEIRQERMLRVRQEKAQHEVHYQIRGLRGAYSLTTVFVVNPGWGVTEMQVTEGFAKFFRDFYRGLPEPIRAEIDASERGSASRP